MNYTAIINIAKTQLGMDEDDYRSMLKNVTGQTSLRVMSERQKNAVLDEMKRMGFASRKNGRRKPAPRASIRYCHVLWGLLFTAGETRVKGAAGLNAFVRARFEKTWDCVPIDIDTMTDERMIRDVVEALKDWCYRKNIDLDIGR